ncbi:hypothetical protein L6452_44677 [Arctium lappa]|uniref:Uncharacterized protein n=1 Tax=Arctium lappa TaxID=4217 RepID=A0ACB8XI66_ARCLA|nr:hypothetical protein L6452_44677 [Arctium lappa]
MSSEEGGGERDIEMLHIDLGPAVVAVVMFVLLSPGLLFQMPARTRIIEFGNMYTSCIAILIHAILYFCIYTILVVTIGIHIHT